MLRRRRRAESTGPPPPPSEPRPGSDEFLEAYETRPPSWQNQLDLFTGQWTSAVPTPGEETTSGPRGDLFDDERVRWAIEELGPLDGLRVLELGPLEGGHTWMLERAGAAEVIAVEAHRNAFLRCLVTKNILGLRATYLLGDFAAYLRDTSERFDVCIASGVLYHMAEPIELLRLVARRSHAAFFWTHYYDEATLARRPDVAARFTGDRARQSAGGYEAEVHRYSYGEGADAASFCGGMRRYTHWMVKDDILGALRHFGMTTQRIGFDDPFFPHGPAFTLVARHP